MRFDFSPDLMPFDTIRKTIQKDCAMRIAKGKSCYGIDYFINRKGVIYDLFMGGTVIKRNILRAQAGDSHFDLKDENILFPLNKRAFSLTNSGLKKDLRRIYFLLVIKGGGRTS